MATDLLVKPELGRFSTKFGALMMKYALKKKMRLRSNEPLGELGDSYGDLQEHYLG